MTTPAVPHPPRRAVGRAIEVVLGLYVGAVFVLLWVSIAAGVVTGGAVLADAWAVLSSLDPIVAAAVWVLILPVAVALWASQAGLPPMLMALVLVGLGLWTVVGASGLAKALRPGH